MNAQYLTFAFNVDSVYRYGPNLIQLKIGPPNPNRKLIVVDVVGCGVTPLRNLSPEAVQKTVAGRKIYVQLFYERFTNIQIAIIIYKMGSHPSTTNNKNLLEAVVR